jgi:hypothetical protein
MSLNDILLLGVIMASNLAREIWLIVCENTWRSQWIDVLWILKADF